MSSIKDKPHQYAPAEGRRGIRVVIYMARGELVELDNKAQEGGYSRSGMIKKFVQAGLAAVGADGNPFIWDIGDFDTRERPLTPIEALTKIGSVSTPPAPLSTRKRLEHLGLVGQEPAAGDDEVSEEDIG